MAGDRVIAAAADSGEGSAIERSVYAKGFAALEAHRCAALRRMRHRSALFVPNGGVPDDSADQPNRVNRAGL
jgi:hypothetical protein